MLNDIIFISQAAVLILYHSMVNICPQQASAFSASYSDSGLFGIYTISQADSTRDVSQIYVQITQCQLRNSAIPSDKFCTHGQSSLTLSYGFVLSGDQGCCRPSRCYCTRKPGCRGSQQSQVSV